MAWSRAFYCITGFCKKISIFANLLFFLLNSINPFKISRIHSQDVTVPEAKFFVAGSGLRVEVNRENGVISIGLMSNYRSN